MVVFSYKTNSVTPLFYFIYPIYLRKIRLYMIYLNLKNFSLFNFQVFRSINYYSLILGVSLEAYRRLICLLFHYFHFCGNFKAFYCHIVLLSQE